MHVNTTKGPNLLGEHTLEQGPSIYPVTVAIFKTLESNKTMRSKINTKHHTNTFNI